MGYLSKEISDARKIRTILFKYIEIINKEYKNSIKRNDNEDIIVLNSGDTISFHVIKDQLYLPLKAYEVFPKLREFSNFGSNREDKREVFEYLDTNTTYADYIRHAIVAGLSEYDYFEESLLHEAMHLCGSGGGTALEEGINELKTRELAVKYNLKTSGYGYPKETEAAKKLQEILGKDIMDELTFINPDDRYVFLSNTKRVEIAELYRIISLIMANISFDYSHSLSHISDPFEKAKLYDSLDYSEVFGMLDSYKKDHNNR